MNDSARSLHAGTNALPPCPRELPPELRTRVIDLAAAWARHPARPVPPDAVAAAWDATLDGWVRADDLPLFVRKHRGDRGHTLRHTSGRVLVPVDNSPAQWTYALACRCVTYTLDEIRRLLAADAVAVAMILTREERAGAHYRRALGKGGTADAGWKLGHIDGVGLRTADAIQTLPIATLEAHHRRLLSPRNLFLIPLAWAGLAELPEVTAAIRQAATYAGERYARVAAAMPRHASSPGLG